MLTITAIIRAKKGHEETVRQALLDHAANVERNEPNTIGFYISQDPNDPCVFATYERFTDQEALDNHNNSESVAKFFAIAGPILDGDVTLLTAEEISFKSQNSPSVAGPCLSTAQYNWMMAIYCSHSSPAEPQNQTSYHDQDDPDRD